MGKPVNITVNGQKVEASAGQTVLQAATVAGIVIPTLCHHPALAPIGACRVCLIEISKQQPLHPACTYPVSEGLMVETQSPRVEKARRFVLELLFSERNHYCMFCEISGNCELQDLGYLFGLDHWLYPTYTTRFPVDASRDAFLMDHNRCILCRRCVRACSELVANHTLGLRERGAKTMISADMNVLFGDSSCITCGTCLQVCPTGSLIDRRSAFMGRNVQTQRTRSTCGECSVGCGMEIVTRGTGILRVEGAWDAVPNGGLLCQKGRFAPLTDDRERVIRPLVRHNGKLQEASWAKALQALAQRLENTAAGEVRVLTTTQATNEALYLLTTLFRQELGVAYIGLLNGVAPTPQLNPALHKGTLADLSKSDLILVIGADPVSDQPVVSFLVKRAVDKGARLIVLDGEKNNLAPFATLHWPQSKVSAAVEAAERADSPVVLYGARLTARAAKALARLPRATFVALEPGANTRAAVALGLGRAADAQATGALYIMAGEQSWDGRKELEKVAPDTFLAVQASYVSPLTERADVVLPAAIWSERAGSLTNLEGRVQQANQAVEPQGEAKADWQILSLLARQLGKKMPDSLEELTARATSSGKLA